MFLQFIDIYDSPFVFQIKIKRLGRWLPRGNKSKKSTKKYLKHHLLPRMLPSLAQVNGHELRCHGLPGYSHEMFIVAFLKTMKKSADALSRIACCAEWHEFLLPWGKRMVLCSSSFCLLTFSRGPFCRNFYHIPFIHVIYSVLLLLLLFYNFTSFFLFRKTPFPLVHI